MSVLALRTLRAASQRGLMGPAAAVFVSANIANVANLLFNMIFAGRLYSVCIEFFIAFGFRFACFGHTLFLANGDL